MASINRIACRNEGCVQNGNSYAMSVQQHRSTATGTPATVSAACQLGFCLPESAHQRRLATRAVSTDTLTSNTVSLGTAHPTHITREARKTMLGSSQEQVSEVEARIQGSVPDWLNGSLVINGGGEYQGMTHYFDGFALLTKVRFQKGRAFGSQRFLQSKAYKHFKATGSLRYREFATPTHPGDSITGMLKNLVDTVSGLSGDLTDNASVSVIPLKDGKLLAMSESITSQYRVDPSDLSTLDHVTLSDGVAGSITTAHAKLLPDGSLVNFTRSTPYGGYHVFIQDPVTLKRKQIAFIKDADPMASCWVHDMALSSKHLIIVENPLHFNLMSLSTGIPTEHVFMDWKPERGSRVHMVALDGSGVKTYPAPTFFSYHTCNAYETADGKQLIVDLSCYDDADSLNAMLLDRLREFPGQEFPAAYFGRLTIPLDAPSGTPLPGPQSMVQDKSQHGDFIEFPDYNHDYTGKPYRYAYALCAQRPTHFGNAVCKIDLQQGTAKRWHENGGSCGGPCFVPAPSQKSEDDGVVLVPYITPEGSSQMLVFDGQSFSLTARVDLPYKAPGRFHGVFLPSA